MKRPLRGAVSTDHRNTAETVWWCAAGAAAAVGVAVVVGGAGGVLAWLGRGSVVPGDRDRDRDRDRVGPLTLDGQAARSGITVGAGVIGRRGREHSVRSRRSSRGYQGWPRWWTRSRNSGGRHSRAFGWLEAWPWSPATPERSVPTPFHSQHIAHWGTCGKTRVVPQNHRPKPEPAEMGVAKCVCCCRRMGHAGTSNRWWDLRSGCGHSARRCGCVRRRRRTAKLLLDAVSRERPPTPV